MRCRDSSGGSLECYGKKAVLRFIDLLPRLRQLVDQLILKSPPHCHTCQEDSTYHAWVSGFNVSLDSIDIFERTVKITQHIREPPKRWGLGLHVGAGYYGTGNKIGPYIGIGISYNILTW